LDGVPVVSAVDDKRVGRVIRTEGRYYIVRRSFGRGCYPLPMREAKVDSEGPRVLMRLPRKTLFAAPKAPRNGGLDPATDLYYSG
jgi:hypothetical protein